MIFRVLESLCWSLFVALSLVRIFCDCNSFFSLFFLLLFAKFSYIELSVSSLIFQQAWNTKCSAPSPNTNTKKGSICKQPLLRFTHWLTHEAFSESFTRSLSRLLLGTENSEGETEVRLSEYALIFHDWTLRAVPAISDFQAHKTCFVCPTLKHHSLKLSSLGSSAFLQLTAASYAAVWSAAEIDAGNMCKCFFDVSGGSYFVLVPCWFPSELLSLQTNPMKGGQRKWCAVFNTFCDSFIYFSSHFCDELCQL